MRVISGKYRGKRLFAPEDNRVRPTTDRIKETMFNILMSRGGVYGTVLDLFSGSGALGIEAISRGAEHAVFIDRDVDSIRLTKENLRHVGITCAEVYHTDYRVALKKLAGRTFDFVFIDPPYADCKEPDIVRLLVENKLLGTDSTVIIEHSSKNELQLLPKSFIIDTRTCGNTCLSFLSQSEEL